LVKTGSPSRAEATDASMAQRAECVMLNKGPHLVEAVKFLDGVLHRMDRHQSKKSARLRPLDVWAIGGGAEKAMLRSLAVAAHLDGDQGTRRLHVNKCEL